jgi:hypothetical protein
MRLFHDLAAANHAFKEEIHLLIQRAEHVFRRSKSPPRARMRAHLLSAQWCDAVVERKLERLGRG